MKVFVVVKHYEYADGFDVVGVYSSRDMADVAISLLSDDEHGEISELETDVLPESVATNQWIQCEYTNDGWRFVYLSSRPDYIYMPYSPSTNGLVPTIFVKADNLTFAQQLAEYEKKYWTEKGVYGCSREHWETIKDQLRVK